MHLIGLGFLKFPLLYLALLNLVCAGKENRNEQKRILECLKELGRDLSQLNWNYGTDDQSINKICKKCKTMAIALGTYGKYLQTMKSKNGVGKYLGVMANGKKDILGLVSVKPSISFNQKLGSADICGAIGKIIEVNQMIMGNLGQSLDWDILGQARFENEAQWKLVNGLSQEYEKMRHLGGDLAQSDTKAAYTKGLAAIAEQMATLRKMKKWVIEDEIDEYKARLTYRHGVTMEKIAEIMKEISAAKKSERLVKELVAYEVIKQSNQKKFIEMNQRKVVEYLEELKRKREKEHKEMVEEMERLREEVEGISFEKELELIRVIKKYVNQEQGQRRPAELLLVLDRIRGHLDTDEKFDFGELTRKMNGYWQRAEQMQTPS